MIWFIVAALLQAAVGLMYLFSLLVAPLYGAVLLWAIWIAATILLVRFRDRGPVIWVIPGITAALWFAVLTLGETLLGWTA
jgi:hypothetical protein